MTFADDGLLLDAGAKMLHDAYQQVAPDYRVIHAADFGMTRVGHFGFSAH